MQIAYARHLLAQATGAFNDNLVRQVFTFAVLAGAVDEASGSTQIALLGLCFMLPFLAAAPLAGALADRWPRHWLLRGIRAAELLLIPLAALALWSGELALLMATIAGLGLQSALFAPIKYAVVPDLAGTDHLEQANGRLSAATQVAMLLGMCAAALVDADLLRGTVFAAWPPAAMLLLVGVLFASLGTLTAWRIPRLPAIDPQRAIRPFAWREQVTILRSERGLLIPALGLSAFWVLAAVINITMQAVARHQFGSDASGNALLAAGLGIAMACGSLLTPRLSAPAYPAALPLISATTTAGCLLGAGLAALGTSAAAFFGWLFTAAFCASWWPVSCNALLHRRAPADRRGAVFAATAFLSNMGLILGFGLMALASRYVPAGLIVQGFALVVLVGLVPLLVRFRLQLAAWPLVVLIRTLAFRLRVQGLQHIPAQGGAVLVGNHLSFADALILCAISPRRIRFVAHAQYVRMPLVGWIMRLAGSIPIDVAAGRRGLLASIQRATALAAEGELVGIFPEGSLSRSACIGAFGRGCERIARGAQVPIIPFCLDGLHGSIFARSPRRHGPQVRRPVALACARAEPWDRTAGALREVVVGLQYHLRQQAADADQWSLGRAALRLARRQPRTLAVADRAGSLNRAACACAALALRPLLGLEQDEERVGVLLPPGRAAAVVQLSIALSGRCAVNLNHTVGRDRLVDMIQRAGVRRVISATPYLERIDLSTDALPVPCLLAEQLLPAIGLLAKLRAWWTFRLVPLRLIDGSCPAAPACLLFSSGSTGTPTGVLLSHAQIRANIQAATEHLGLTQHAERVCSALPYFHSFGLSIGCWLGLTQPVGLVLHPDPADGAGLGRLIAEQQATFMVSTPTFFRGNLRRMQPAQVSSLRFCVVGAERCPQDLIDQAREDYAIELLEGYGATELGPVVACNQPSGLDPHRRCCKAGSVGRCLPGVAPERVPAPEFTDGAARLLIRSPARMSAYLDDPERTAAALQDGAYNTGDIVSIDAEGFLRLRGRAARFAKIGGEMVPLDHIEETLAEGLALDRAAGEDLAVCAVPDERRGERLMVLLTRAPERAAIEAASQALPPVFRPRVADCYQVANLPLLGSGKRDFAALRVLATTYSAGHAGPEPAGVAGDGAFAAGAPERTRQG